MAVTTRRPQRLRRLVPLVQLLLVLGAAAAGGAEDDFAFENAPGDEEEAPAAAGVVVVGPDAGVAAAAAAPGLAPVAPTAGAPVRRHWGVPDAVATVGHLFRLRVPDDAFSGDVLSYEVVGAAPAWLRLGLKRGGLGAAGVLEGVPGPGDAGDHYVTLRARGAAGDAAKDVFAVEVRPRGATLRDLRSDMECRAGEAAVVVTVALDAAFGALPAAQRVTTVKSAAAFLGVPAAALWLGPQRGREDLLSAAVVAAGPGDARRQSASEPSALRWAAGCGPDAQSALQRQLEAPARDGTLAEVLGAPVIGWHARTVGGGAGRERREVGSGDSALGDDEPNYNYDDEADPEPEEAVPETRIIPTMASPVFPGATSSAASLPPLPPQPPEHPHRHHHGEMTVPSSQDGDGGPPEQPDEEPAEAYPTRHLPTSPVLFAGTIMSTPVLVPVRPTRIGPPDDGGLLQPTRVYTAYAEVTPSATPVFYSEIEPSASSDLPSTQVTEPLPSSSSTPAGSSSSSGSASTSETSSPTSGSTSFSPGSSPSFSTEPTSPSPEDTESPSPQSPSLPTFPTERSTTEKVEYGVKNIPPQLAHRLPKLALTAGKTFRYSIPSDTFSDLEDGDTKKLRLIFMHLNKTSIMSSSWVQFDIEKQEIYALPLEEHVSKWEFLLEAMDKEGSSVTETLALQVQHHKARRAVNHEFMISLRPPDRIHYASNLDWELDLLNAVARTVGDADNSHITVRAVNTSADPNIFAWTNDSLPRSPCPKEEIEQIMQMLADKNGSPSQRLKEAVPNSLHLRKVSWRGLAPCDRPQVHPGPPQPRNFPPVTRNPIDEIEAIEGRLLVFKVPSDMFYDPELQPLKVTLMTINNQPIPKESWLQFDSRNWEFYGLPMIGDKGRTEYNLVCEDSEGLMAYDALVVVVRPAPDVQYTAEFSMELQVPFEQFSLSASLKRRFIERIRDLFGDRDTSAVALARNPRPRGGGGGGGGGTVVTWYNASLPADRCSEHSIRALRRVLLQDDESVATRVRHIMDLEFPVESVTLTPTGACLGAMTEVHVDVAPSAAPDRKDTVPVGTPGDDYLVTYIVPAVIIVAMLLLAGLVACVLYRRRRTGKMSVGDEDERQSFRNKGIPVIFQDELEERPDPANKSPVIMKEEKPPLPPPEYQRGAESTPGTDRGTPPPSAVSAAAAAPGPGVAAAAVRRPLLGPDGSPAPAPEDPPYQPPPPFTSSRDTGRGARPKPTPTYRKPPPYVPP